MYITCYNLYKLNLYMGGSCHTDADDWPDTYPLIEVLGESIGLKDEDKVIGELCCALDHDLLKTSEGREILKKCYETKEIK